MGPIRQNGSTRARGTVVWAWGSLLRLSAMRFVWFSDKDLASWRSFAFPASDQSRAANCGEASSDLIRGPRWVRGAGNANLAKCFVQATAVERGRTVATAPRNARSAECATTVSPRSTARCAQLTGPIPKFRSKRPEPPRILGNYVLTESHFSCLLLCWVPKAGVWPCGGRHVCWNEVQDLRREE